MWKHKRNNNPPYTVDLCVRFIRKDNPVSSSYSSIYSAKLPTWANICYNAVGVGTDVSGTTTISGHLDNLVVRYADDGSAAAVDAYRLSYTPLTTPESGPTDSVWFYSSGLLGFERIVTDGTYVNADGIHDVYGHVLQVYPGVYATVYNYAPPSRYRTEDTMYHYLTDPLGTPQMVLSGDGTPMWAADYAPFGRLLADRVGIGFHQPVRFPGQYEDEESGLHYNVHRYYDPDTGRYLSVDRVVVASYGRYLADIAHIPEYYSTYGYASDNPVNYYDPNGRQTTYGRWEAPDPDLYPAIDDPSFGERGSELNKGLRDLAVIGGATAGACGVAAATASYSGILAIHAAHHTFWLLGGKKLPHIQLNVWRPGVKDSGMTVFRIPLPSNWKWFGSWKW